MSPQAPKRPTPSEKLRLSVSQPLHPRHQGSSTPATMTTTIPHHPHDTHQRFLNGTPTLGSFSNHSLSNGRLATSHSFQHPSSSRQSAFASRQLPPLGPIPASNSTPQLPPPDRRDRKPNWDEFYRNGPPKEIIVIDDDSPPPNMKRKAPARRPSPQVNPGAAARQPAAKKRRTGAYDAARDYQPSYTNGRNYSHGDSTSNTVSTDRTTSLKTTAPTSL